MDCEKFDLVVIDLLYGELDELPRATAQRHAQQCSRCRKILSDLRATREATTLVLEDPPEDLEDRILAAERLAREALPLKARVTRALTIAAGYAMRPQLAMAALLLLMIGSSLLLLRPRPGTHSAVHVTEQGVPEADLELVVSVDPEVKQEIGKTEEPPAPPATPTVLNAAPTPSSPTAAPPPADELIEDDPARKAKEDQAYAAAMDSYRAGNYAGSLAQFDELVQSGSSNAAAAELYAALSSEHAEGCAEALSRFDSVSARNPNNSLGHQATWHSATCRSQLGRDRRALLDFQKLVRVPAYERQALAALSQLSQRQPSPLHTPEPPGEVKPATKAADVASTAEPEEAAAKVSAASGPAASRARATSKKKTTKSGTKTKVKPKSSATAP